MPNLTKQDIDGLVTNMASQNFNPTAAWDALRKALYLAAGLTATGERKPERAGEEYEVLEADVAYGPYKHLGSVTTTIVELNDYTYKPGDRVRVTRIEEGET